GAGDAALTDVLAGAPRAGQTLYGDRLLIAVEPNAGEDELYLLGTPAPGQFRARRTGPPAFVPAADYEDRIRSAWQEIPGGFAVEARLPLTFAGEALGIAFIDVDRVGGDYRVELVASWDVEHGAPGALVHQQPDLERFLRPFS